MLVTTCSYCRSRFRVTPQQLNEKQGKVRCGRCRKVFNGFEALERFPDDDTGARLLAAQDVVEDVPESAAALPREDDLPEIESVQSAPPVAAALPATPPAVQDARPAPGSPWVRP